MEALAGKRQGQIVAATIRNFDAAREAMEQMENSAGSADREMAIIQQSLEYKINALRQAGTGIAQNLFQRDDMKSLVDGLTGVLNVIDAITEKLGLFGTLAVGGGITAFIKNLD